MALCRKLLYPDSLRLWRLDRLGLGQLVAAILAVPEALRVFLASALQAKHSPLDAGNAPPSSTGDGLPLAIMLAPRPGRAARPISSRRHGPKGSPVM